MENCQCMLCSSLECPSCPEWAAGQVPLHQPSLCLPLPSQLSTELSRCDPIEATGTVVRDVPPPGHAHSQTQNSISSYI